MKSNRGLIIILIIALALTSEVYAITIGGGPSVAVESESSARGVAVADSNGVTTSMNSNGLVTIEDNHWIEDITGKHAEISVIVVNGQDVDYASIVSPGEGKINELYASVSAEERPGRLLQGHRVP